MPIYVGFESANSYVKSISSETEKVDIYLNTLTPVSKQEYEDNQNGTGTTNNEVYEVDGKYYKVGKIITSSAQSSSGANDITRYKTKEWQAEALIAIYRQVKNKNNFSNQHIYVVTGLPTNHSYDEQVRLDIQKFLNKHHSVNGKGMRIVDSEIISQGESTFFDNLLTYEGDFSEEFLMGTSPDDEDQESNLLYIDIGHGTTDYRQVRDYTPDKRYEIPGMESVWTDLLDIAMEKNPKLATADAQVLGVEKQLQEGGIIDYKKVVVDVFNEREQLLQEYADKVINQISKAPYSRIFFDQVRFCGGGSILLKTYLQKAIYAKFGGDSAQIERFIFLENPQETNARGYLKYCLKLFKN